MWFRKLRRDERGMSLVFVALGFMGFFAATMLAIDVGMLMTARSQAQNSADAGALAGAVALGFVDYNDRTASGPAVTGAIRQATANQVMYANVSVTPPDVEFPPNPTTGEFNRVRVTVRRTSDRGNPVNTLIAGLFGISTASIGAVATAEVSPADTEDCVLPFMVPDKWREVTTPPFNSLTSSFDIYANVPGNGGESKGAPLATPDVYIPATDRDYYTGYRADLDKGTELDLKTSNDTKAYPSVYHPIVLPGNPRGAAEFRAAIAGCFHATFTYGEDITVEPGNMVGPTKQGVDDLVAQDPGAYWDTACNCVKGSAFGQSPRIRPIPLYDPRYYEDGKHGGRNADYKVANFLGVFVVGMRGNDVIARITPMAGKRSGNATVPGGFPKAIRLVQ